MGEGGPYHGSVLEGNLDGLHHPEAQGGGGDVHDVREHLEDGVGPEGEAAGQDAHQDGADGEEDDEGEGAEDAVHATNAGRLVDVEADAGATEAAGAAGELAPVAIAAAVELGGDGREGC